MTSKKPPVSKIPPMRLSPFLPVGKFLRTSLGVLERITETIGAILLAAMTLLIFLQVIIRFKVIRSTIPWTEEIALMFLVWFGLTGAAIGIRKGTHIGVEFLFALFGPKTKKVVNIFIGLLIILFSVFLLIEGIALVQGTIDVFLSASLLSRGLCVYLAVPISAVLMLLYSIEFIINQFTTGGNNNDV
ncbi:MAG: TRAP transporter small permease [Firmicutes bacterium]|nr:TRAP transporter small permease [Bacillota bacterium]